MNYFKMPDIVCKSLCKEACIEIANSMYKRKHGESMDSIARVTAAGIVITPQDISKYAASVIKKFRRIVLK